MRYPLIVFDFDGTLVDSLEASVAIFQRLAPQLGLTAPMDLESARGTPTRQLFRDMGLSFWKLPRVVRTFQNAAAEEAENLKLFTGMQEVLAALVARGHRLGVLSSNREDTIRRCLRTNTAEDHFAFVHGYPRLFGKGRLLRRILRQEQVEAGNVLYVGDEQRDVEAARKARVAVAAVTWGFHTEALLTSAAPTFLLRDPGELLHIA